MRVRVWLYSAVCVAGATLAAADTLVLKNGRRVEGQLIAVRGDTIEFEESGRRNQRYDRADVRRIELDERGSGGWSDRRDRDGRRDDEGSAQTGGMRERSVIVSATTAWNDTGVDVRSGQRIRFHATGEVRWGPGRKDGPAGEGGSHPNQGRPMPSRAGAALIGRIGSGSDLFFIGDDEGEIRVRNSGRLYLGVNDDYLQDNSGSFRVTVYY